MLHRQELEAVPADADLGQLEGFEEVAGGAETCGRPPEPKHRRGRLCRPTSPVFSGYCAEPKALTKE